MKLVLTILIFVGLCCKVMGQPVKNKFIFIPDRNKYVLSERIKLNKDISFDQTFNSLFIWQKDKVIRIIFKHQKKIRLKEVDSTQIQRLNLIIPPIKNYTVYNSIQENDPYGHLLLSDSGRKENKINTTMEQKYKLKILININKWNNRNNPLADTLTTSVISDENSYVLAKNHKRKAEYCNNLPIIFSLDNSRSFFYIKPYRIDIYNADTLGSALDDTKNKIQRFSLYSTISLMDNSFLDKPTRIISWGDQLNIFLYHFISYHTPTMIYKLSLPNNNTISYLSKFQFARQQFYPTKGPDSLTVLSCGDLPYNEFLEEYPSSIHNSYAQSKNFGHCPREYQYCKKCYDASISIKEKIINHCPLNLIAKREWWSDENWSFLFSNGKYSFFKTELVVKQNECGNPKLWQLFSPGIGFWMSNVAIDNAGNYFIPDISKPFFSINNQTLRNFIKN